MTTQPTPTTTEALRELVLEATREVLGNGSISETDDFFELGGDSLLGLRLLARIEEATGAELSVATLFTHPTPGELAGALEEHVEATGSAGR